MLDNLRQEIQYCEERIKHFMDNSDVFDNGILVDAVNYWKSRIESLKQQIKEVENGDSHTQDT